MADRTSEGGRGEGGRGKGLEGHWVMAWGRGGGG